MAYKCSFLDNETYVAQDVNDIFARITTGGVVFTDTGYTLGDLNTVQSNVVGSGVTRDKNSCLVIKDGDIYKILKGACFMNDGSAIIFDEDGQEIEITPGVINYVYLTRNIIANSIDIVVSENVWDEDSIPLAEINEDGEIFDKRKYARAKVDLATCENVRNFTVNIPKTRSSSSETVTVDLGDGAFSHIIMWDGKIMHGDVEYERVASGRNLKALVEDEFIDISISRHEGSQSEIMYCKKDGQKIHIYLYGAFNDAEYVLNLGVI